MTARVLGTPVLHGLGVISYPLYMTHSFVIHVAPRLRDGLMSGGGAGRTRRGPPWASSRAP